MDAIVIDFCRLCGSQEETKEIRFRKSAEDKGIIVRACRKCCEDWEKGVY